MNKSVLLVPYERDMLRVFFIDKTAARKHASSGVQTIRTWANVAFAKGLSRERNSDEKAKLLDELFERLVGVIALAPADRFYNRIDHLVTIAKTGEV